MEGLHVQLLHVEASGHSGLARDHRESVQVRGRAFPRKRLRACVLAIGTCGHVDVVGEVLSPERPFVAHIGEVLAYVFKDRVDVLGSFRHEDFRDCVHVGRDGHCETYELVEVVTYRPVLPEGFEALLAVRDVGFLQDVNISHASVPQMPLDNHLHVLLRATGILRVPDQDSRERSLDRH